MSGRKQEKSKRSEARRAAEAEAARGRRQRKVTAIAGAGLLAALVAIIVVANSSGGEAAPIGPNEPVLGDPDAPVTIIEYGDFKCPTCTSFFTETEPEIRRELIETGKARLVWRDFPVIDSESGPAAEAARCAGAQGRFWEYHDALFTFISERYYSRGENVEGRSAYAGNYGRLARQAGVPDLTAFRRCLRTGSERDAVNRAREAGMEAGVSGTPTFFVNGQRVVGAQPYDVFRRLVEAEAGG